MNREEKIKAFEMKLDGYTYEEIAKYFGTSRQNVQQALTLPVTRKNCSKYVGLNELMMEHHLFIKTLFESIKDKYGIKDYQSFLRKIKTGKNLTINEIKAILEYTGMTFEEIFGKEVEYDRNNRGDVAGHEERSFMREEIWEE